MFDFIYDWFFGLIWSGLMNFVQLIWDLIIWLSGGTPSVWFCNNILKTSQSGAMENNLLQNLLLGDQIMMLFGIMVAVAGTLIVITIIVAVIRSEISADDSVKSKKKLIGSSFKAILITLLLPTIFYFAILLFNSISNLLVASMKSNNASIINLLIMIGGGDAANAETISLLDWSKLSGIASNQMNTSLSGTGITLKGFNWLLVLLISLVCIIVLAIAVLPLVERLIVLALLVVAAPIVCAIYPLDDGNRFGIWKDLFISKMLSALGIILCLQIYIILCSIINTLIPTSFLGSICKVVIMVLGLFVFNKGAHILANLVGHSTGMAEGQSQMSTLHAIGAIIHGGSMIANMGKGAASSLGGAKDKVGGSVKEAGAIMGGDKGGSKAMSGLMQSMTHPTSSLSMAKPGGNQGSGIGAIGGGGGQGVAPSSNSSMQNTNNLASGTSQSGKGNSIAANEKAIATPASGMPTGGKNAMGEVAATNAPQSPAKTGEAVSNQEAKAIQTEKSGLGASNAPISQESKSNPLLNQTNIAQGNAIETPKSDAKTLPTITTGTSGIANLINDTSNKNDNDVADGGTKK